MNTLDAVLRPRSVAVVGASRNPGSIGWQILHNLLHHRFDGAVYPVNPKAHSVHSIKAYPSLADVPDDVDLAVIVVPAVHVLDVVEQSVAKGVKGLVIISAGFKEIGGDGVDRERELENLIAGSGIRVVGPNCMGVINTEDGVSLNATFAPAMPPKGPVALMSQSGAMGLSILDYAGSLGLGLSMFVSAGNKMDVSGNDLLKYWMDDPLTHVVLMYLENIKDAAGFVEIGRRITRTKPVVVVKSGRTGAGARAAASHTGALAQTDVVTDSLIRQAGAIRAQTVEELFDLAMAFSNQPLPQGNRVAIVTNAGGPGIIIADACEAHGIEVTPLTADTEEKLRAKLPEEASVRNPVDLIASARPELYEHALRAVQNDPNVDAVIAAFVPPLGIQTKDVANAIVRANDNHADKPVMAVLMGRQGLPAGMAELHHANIPAYIFPESAARALGAMWKYAQQSGASESRIVEFDHDDAAVAQLIEATLERGNARLSEPDALRVLEAYGIATVPWKYVARSDDLEQDVAAAATELGFPIALKVVSQAIVHKTDAGGIELDLASADACREAVRRIRASVAAANQGEEPDGILVQCMAGEGRETIVGLTRIPGMPPMVMFGLGGIYVEVMRDVVLRLCPVLDTDAADMVRSVRMYKLLEGVRGAAPRDLSALETAILKLSQLAMRHPAITEMDINPLLSLERGAVAIDARIAVEVTHTEATGASR